MIKFNEQVVNHHLIRDLSERGLWSDSLKMEIISKHGSVQNIEGIPQDLKDLYKTVWEISQKTILSMAADRGCYIDQSQSLNVHIAEINNNIVEFLNSNFSYVSFR